MVDRNQVILERIRRDLRRKGIEVTDPEELYDECNRVQTFIIQDIKCVDREITIETISGQEEYSLIDESAVTLLDYSNSWNGKMNLIATENWGKYKNLTGSDPYHFSIFSGKIKFSPIPLRDNDVITFMVRQTDVVNKMDDDIEPEIPAEFDECLVLGVCAKYDETFEPRFLGLLERTKGNTPIHSILTKVEPTW